MHIPQQIQIPPDAHHQNEQRNDANQISKDKGFDGGGEDALDPTTEAPFIEKHAAEMHRTAFVHEVGKFENGNEVDGNLERLQHENNFERCMIVSLFFNNPSTARQGYIFQDAAYAG